MGPLQQRNERVGSYGAQHRVLPSHQRFHAQDPAVQQVDLGLVMQAEQIVLYGPAQVRQQGQLHFQVCLSGIAVHPYRLTELTGVVQGQIQMP